MYIFAILCANNPHNPIQRLQQNKRQNEDKEKKQ